MVNVNWDYHFFLILKHLDLYHFFFLFNFLQVRQNRRVSSLEEANEH